MAQRLVNIDRQTPMLLPPDLRDWVAENDLAKLILEAVELCDLGPARLNVRGTGSEQYPPRMMLALLIYCYATKVFSSRQIERATYESVAVRYLCANHHPDHDTIATFRRENAQLFRQCLSQVLLLAGAAGMLKMGTINLDGTRLAGAGSMKAVRRLSEIEAEIENLGKQLLKEAEAADAVDGDAGGMQLPAELGDAQKRREKLLAARDQILARREAARQAGTQDQPQGGTRTELGSVSEPESRTLKRGGGPSVQGYNAQALSDAGRSGLILGAHLTNAANDAGQINAGLQTLAPGVGTPAVLVVDSGYDAHADIAMAESRHGVLVLCPPQRRPNANPKRVRYGEEAVRWARRRQMEARMNCPLLERVYGRRKPTAEGVFARIKRHMGFTRFHCWGMKNAGAEWQLVCLAQNCRQLALRWRVRAKQGPQKGRSHPRKGVLPAVASPHDTRLLTSHVIRPRKSRLRSRGQRQSPGKTRAVSPTVPSQPVRVGQASSLTSHRPPVVGFLSGGVIRPRDLKPKAGLGNFERSPLSHRLRPGYRCAALHFLPSMKHLAILACLSLVPAAVLADEPIFNGKDLTGWEGNPKLWSVENGCITGRTGESGDTKLKHNTFLVWKGTVADFDLTFKYRIEKGNSGVQYRSKLLPPGENGPIVAGYQADFEAGKTYSGILYEERGRGILAKRGEKTVIKEGGKPEVVGEVGKSDEIQASIKSEDWNEYHVIAKGNHLQHFINGKQTVDVTDEDTQKGAKEGILALQIHAGPAMVVQFKDIVLKKL